MAKNSKDKNIDFIRHSESLDRMKRYFGIVSQEDDKEFKKYIKRHTNLYQDDKLGR